MLTHRNNRCGVETSRERAAALATASSPSPGRRILGPALHRALVLGLMALGAVGVVGVGPSAVARQEAVAPAAPATPAALELPEAMAAFQRVSDWMKHAKVQEQELPDSGHIRLASVVVRLDGRVIGRGWLQGETGVVAGAAKRALALVESGQPAPKDLLAENFTAQDRQRSVVSAEFAGEYIPISPKTYDEVDRDLAPGIDGVAVRIGERFEAVFPEYMLAMRMSPGDALASAIARAADDPSAGLRVDPKGQPADAATNRGAVFYRFRPVQIAEVGGVARFLYRGDDIFRESEVTTPLLRDYAHKLATYLLNQRATPDPDAPQGQQALFRGAALPAQGRYETPFAGDAEQAACAWALLHYELLDLNDTHSGEAAALSVLSQLSRPSAGSAEPRFLASIGATAMWAVLAAEARYAFPASDPPNTEPRPEWKACRERLVSLCNNMDAIPPGQRGLIACALARVAAAEHSDILRQGARLAAAAVFERTPPAQMPAEMPWLGWTLLENAPAAQPVDAAPALREFRDLCYKHQLSPTTVSPETRDMSGGIMLAGNTLYPTWFSTRPLAFVCTMLGDARLTSPDERAKEMARLIPSLRYLRQLAADEAIARLHAHPAQTQWGVRAAMWDLRQPPEAAAMTLVAVCEALQSLDAIAGGTK